MGTRISIIAISLMMLFCEKISANGFYLNSVGYFPEQAKIASVDVDIEAFSVVDAENDFVCFVGKTSEPVFQEDVQKTVRFADFSSITTPGKYYLKANGGKLSATFAIGKTIYNQPYVTTMRAFYLWRCGTAVSGEYNGNLFFSGACHMEDGWLDSIGYANTQKDGTGGWHDAGDHGKYVVNAGITLGMMFMAWEQFSDKLNKFDLGLPETAPGFPEYLKELKWETDWLLKMTYPDGSGRVSHKLTRTHFEGFVMPADDKEKRYFTEWSSAATADFVAMMAMASRIFKPYDEGYAQKCLDAAMLSYRFLKENPADRPFPRGGFHTGGYQSPDKDDRLWAAVEMWETTGDKAFLSDFESCLDTMKTKIDEDWDWGNVRNLATFRYILSEREGKNPALLSEAKKQLIEVADAILHKAQTDIFARPLGSTYYWGCNGTVARQVLNLQIANKIKPNIGYTNASLDALSNIFGRNHYGRSFVTGIGHQPPMYPHDRRSGADSVIDPWPGYIVGGGTKSIDWVDVEASYSTNEVAINWQAALVYALACFID